MQSGRMVGSVWERVKFGTRTVPDARVSKRALQDPDVTLLKQGTAAFDHACEAKVRPRLWPQPCHSAERGVVVGEARDRDNRRHGGIVDSALDRVNRYAGGMVRNPARSVSAGPRTGVLRSDALR